MDHAEAVSKAMRLLKLAKSDNAHEAASAMAKAQAIMDKYKLGTLIAEEEPEATHAPEEPIQNFGHAPLDGEDEKNLSTWRARLASTIAHANQCRIYTTGPRINIVGRPSDVETTRYLYQWLTKETDRLTALHGAGCGKGWRNNFRLGVIDALAETLRKQQEATRQEAYQEASLAPVGPSAIVRVDRALARIEQRGAEVDQWMGTNMKLGRARTQRTSYNPSARQAGYKAGKTIQVGGAKAGLTGGNKKLGSG